MEENREPSIRSSWETVLEPIEHKDIPIILGQDFINICEEEHLSCWIWPKDGIDNHLDLYIEVRDRTLIFSQMPNNPTVFACNFAYTKDIKDAMKEKPPILKKFQPDINKKIFDKNHNKLQKDTVTFGRLARDLVNSLASTDITIEIAADKRRLECYKRMFDENNPRIAFLEIDPHRNIVP